MDSDIRQRLASAAKDLKTPTDVHKAPLKSARKSTRKKRLLVGVPLVIVAAGLVVLGVYLLLGHRQAPDPGASSLVSAEIRGSVPFPVPYPLPSSLPSGYNLDRNSFSMQSQVVVYSVSYEQGKKVAFTVQQKPSDEDLKTFYANQLPLRLEVATSVGTASVGVLNDKTFASLPTKGNAWVLITAPKDINPEKFNQTLKALQQ